MNQKTNEPACHRQAKACLWLSRRANKLTNQQTIFGSPFRLQQHYFAISFNGP